MARKGKAISKEIKGRNDYKTALKEREIDTAPILSLTNDELKNWLEKLFHEGNKTWESMFQIRFRDRLLLINDLRGIGLISQRIQKFTLTPRFTQELKLTALKIITEVSVQVEENQKIIASFLLKISQMETTSQAEFKDRKSVV